MVLTSGLLIVAAVTVGSVASFQVIDMSHKLLNTTYHHYWTPPFRQVNDMAQDILPGVYSQSGHYLTSEHTSTHVDAPVHFSRGGMTTEDMAIEMTIADGVTIDCREEVRMNKNYGATKQKVMEWERRYGRIPDRAAVIFDFGMSRYFETDFAEYTGNPRNISLFDDFRFPYVTMEAVQWLYDERDIKLLATDTISPEMGKINGVSTNFGIHTLLLKNNRVILENLKIPEKMPAKGFRFHAPPVRIQGATGTPVRAFAILTSYDRKDSSGNSAMTTKAELTTWIGISGMFLYLSGTILF